MSFDFLFFFQAEDGIRDIGVTGVQTCALPIFFFSNVGRSLEEEDEIRLTSVGVDIGSSTSHLVFSRLVLERLDNRYIVDRKRVRLGKRVDLGGRRIL